MLTTCASRTEHGRPYLGRGLTARAACLGALLTQRPRMWMHASGPRVCVERVTAVCRVSCAAWWGGVGGEEECTGRVRMRARTGTRAHATPDQVSQGKVSGDAELSTF
jgi:hypothetical protein